MRHEPAAWETSAAGPFLSVDEVDLYARGEDRFRLVAPEGEREVEGFEPARQLAHTSSLVSKWLVTVQRGLDPHM